eukprot:2527960-Amphidinium_carterae.3
MSTPPLSRNGTLRSDLELNWVAGALQASLRRQAVYRQEMYEQEENRARDTLRFEQARAWVFQESNSVIEHVDAIRDEAARELLSERLRTASVEVVAQARARQQTEDTQRSEVQAQCERLLEVSSEEVSSLRERLLRVGTELTRAQEIDSVHCRQLPSEEATVARLSQDLRSERSRFESVASGCMDGRSLAQPVDSFDHFRAQPFSHSVQARGNPGRVLDERNVQPWSNRFLAQGPMLVMPNAQGLGRGSLWASSGSNLTAAFGGGPSSQTACGGCGSLGGCGSSGPGMKTQLPNIELEAAGQGAAPSVAIRGFEVWALKVGLAVASWTRNPEIAHSWWQECLSLATGAWQA